MERACFATSLAIICICAREQLTDFMPLHFCEIIIKKIEVIRKYMDVKHYTDTTVTSNLKALFKASRAIPFFGTGFTRECQAKNGKVPDANAFAEIITRTASSKPDLESHKKSEILNIKDLKTAFEFLTSEKYITVKQRQALLGNLFSNVNLGSRIKIALLNLDWPHIFSFNIDDAIEQSTRKYQLILPNRPVSREFISANNCLFKIHGDIGEYIKYDNPNVVFTWRQYVKSIRTNTAMLTFLEEQAQHCAFLFIGCSLDAELDLLHIEAKRQFENSIYLKRGNITVSEELRLESYGINQVITFDSYEQIYEWLYETLKGEQCESPFKALTIEEKLKDIQEGVELIANGGPLIQEDHSGNRIARKLNIFPRRNVVTEALELLRVEQYLFITGRRFSGKTTSLLQLLGELQHFSCYYYASSDVFNSDLKPLVNSVENSAFFFDSNYLDVDSLSSLLSWKTHHTNRFIICSSSGDAEIFRYTFQSRNIKIPERSIDNKLTESDTISFNGELSKFPLPEYKLGETLLNFAYRYYDAYKNTLPGSEIFGKNIKVEDFKILAITSAFGKASESIVNSVHPYFDFNAFVKEYDRLFEAENDVSSGRVLICNSSSWLIARTETFIRENTLEAVDAISTIISCLIRDGFQTSAYSLITFNKLNELCGIRGVNDQLIRGVFQKVEQAFQGNEHYWLQRAKCELIMGASADSINDGIRFAMPLHVNNKALKNQTYYSATLLLAQLFSRMYKFEKRIEILLGLLDFYLESVSNYENNRRHIDKIIAAYCNKKSDIRLSMDALKSVADIKLLARRNDIQKLLSFFKLQAS